MITNLDEFLKELEVDENTLLTSVNDKVKGTAKAVFTQLLLPKSQGGTPKVTSHLRSNWITTLDSKFDSVIGSPKNVDISKREKSWDKFLGISDLYSHTIIWFNNNVEYGPLVNFGTSKIKPQNFKAKAVQAGNEWLKAHRK